jgi:hypothetical protein
MRRNMNNKDFGIKCDKNYSMRGESEYKSGKVEDVLILPWRYN